jgi:hypothetical protein
VALSQGGRSRDSEDSKTNNDDFLHAQLPRQRRTAVNHKPWIKVKNRSQSEPKSAIHSSPSVRRVAERIGAPATIALGAGLSASGCLGLLGIEPGTSYWEIGAQLTILGGGLGLLVPPLTSTLLGSVEKARSGKALPSPASEPNSATPST